MQNLEDIVPQFCSLTNITTDRSHNKIFFPLLAYAILYGAYKNYVVSADFSGKGALALYDLMASNYNFKINTASKNASFASQLVFHGMLGTYLENLNLLSNITTQGETNKI